MQATKNHVNLHSNKLRLKLSCERKVMKENINLHSNKLRLKRLSLARIPEQLTDLHSNKLRLKHKACKFTVFSIEIYIPIS